MLKKKNTQKNTTTPLRVEKFNRLRASEENGSIKTSGYYLLVILAQECASAADKGSGSSLSPEQPVLYPLGTSTDPCPRGWQEAALSCPARGAFPSAAKPRSSQVPDPCCHPTKPVITSTQITPVSWEKNDLMHTEVLCWRISLRAAPRRSPRLCQTCPCRRKGDLSLSG